MQLVILIIVLALIQYILFAFQVGKARVKYNIKAPAVSGHPIFERHMRVQMNNIEQLILFIPSILTFSYMAESLQWPGNEIAAGLGVVWLIGRALFANAYVKNPELRGPGFGLTFFPSVLMLAGTLICVLISVI